MGLLGVGVGFFLLAGWFCVCGFVFFFFLFSAAVKLHCLFCSSVLTEIKTVEIKEEKFKNAKMSLSSESRKSSENKEVSGNVPSACSWGCDACLLQPQLQSKSQKTLQ